MVESSAAQCDSLTAVLLDYRTGGWRDNIIVRETLHWLQGPAMIQRPGVNQSVQTVSQPDIPEIPEIQLSGEAGDDWEGGKGGKVRLVRSEAIRDSSSPPPGHPASEAADGGETLAGDAVSCTDSGRGDTDTPDGEIYTDNTGTDLTQFIISTLNKNAKDKVLMLKLEQEMSNLVKDSKKTHHKFPHMSSYHRMLVHR